MLWKNIYFKLMDVPCMENCMENMLQTDGCTLYGKLYGKNASNWWMYLVWKIVWKKYFKLMVVKKNVSLVSLYGKKYLPFKMISNWPPTVLYGKNAIWKILSKQIPKNHQKTFQKSSKTVWKIMWSVPKNPPKITPPKSSKNQYTYIHI